MLAPPLSPWYVKERRPNLFLKFVSQQPLKPNSGWLSETSFALHGFCSQRSLAVILGPLIIQCLCFWAQILAKSANSRAILASFRTQKFFCSPGTGNETTGARGTPAIVDVLGVNG